jgi:hypothetical protein
MILKLMNRFAPLMNGVSFLPVHGREDVETFVHETAHLITLFGAKKTKEILIDSLNNNEQVPVNKSLKEKLKTIKSQNNNEIKTTAITILATEQLGGGTFQESIRSMLSNLNYTHSKIKDQEYINQCVKLMMNPKIQGQANVLAKMLLEMEKDSSHT